MFALFSSNDDEHHQDPPRVTRDHFDSDPSTDWEEEAVDPNDMLLGDDMGYDLSELGRKGERKHLT